MFLPSRSTVTICVHLLQTKHDELIKAGVKTYDSEGNDTGEPIIKLKHALDDLIRYDASIELLQSSFQNFESD